MVSCRARKVSLYTAAMSQAATSDASWIRVSGGDDSAEAAQQAAADALAGAPPASVASSEVASVASRLPPGAEWAEEGAGDAATEEWTHHAPPEVDYDILMAPAVESGTANGPLPDFGDNDTDGQGVSNATTSSAVKVKQQEDAGYEPFRRQKLVPNCFR